MSYAIYYRVIFQDDDGIYQSNSKLFSVRDRAEEYTRTIHASRKPIMFEETARTLARLVSHRLGCDVKDVDGSESTWALNPIETPNNQEREGQ